MIKKISNRIMPIAYGRLSILSVVFIGFTGLTLVATLTLYLMGYQSTRFVTKRYHNVIIENTMQRLGSEVDQLLTPIEFLGNKIQADIDQAHLNITDSLQLETYMRAALGAVTDAAGIAYIEPSGAMRLYLPAQGTILQDQVKPEIRDALFAPSSIVLPQPQWGNLIWSTELSETVLDFRIPVLQDGTLKGYFIIGVGVNALSHAITMSSEDQSFTPFILYGPDHILAHPNPNSFHRPTSLAIDQYNWVTGQGALPLSRLDEKTDPLLTELLNAPLNKVNLITPIIGVTVGQHVTEDALYILATRKSYRYGPIPWTLGLYINASTSEQSGAQLVSKVGGVGLVILIATVLVSLKIGRHLSRPIQRMSHTATLIQQNYLQDITPLPRSRLREFDRGALALNEMVDALKERDHIREVFGRYVPHEIVQSLMAENGSLKPVATTATILYSDLVGFTQLTHAVGAEGIVRILNAYFEKVVAIVERHKGVVTQFQGDALLVTFNVPIQSSDHASLAFRCAQEITDLLQTERFEGMSLRCRIGLSTGPIIAGAIGAKGRLNYTVHGDPVNLASRLEAYNKITQTHIMIASETYDMLSDDARETLEPIDVKGILAADHAYILKKTSP